MLAICRGIRNIAACRQSPWFTTNVHVCSLFLAEVVDVVPEWAFFLFFPFSLSKLESKITSWNVRYFECLILFLRMIFRSILIGNVPFGIFSQKFVLSWQLNNCGFHSSIWLLIIDSDRHSTTREIAENLHVSHTCIENHLKQLGYVQKLDTWVPHELKEKHLTQH